MKNRLFALVLALVMALSLFGCGQKPAADDTGDAPETVTVTDMIGRELELTPGSYQRVVCIGAGALRLYSYVGDVSLLCGVEDIDNTTLSERPQMFDGVARPYVMVYGDTFAALPSCGVGGPNAQAAEAEKILSCTPDIIVSEYETRTRRTPCSSRPACRWSLCAPAWTACSATTSAAPSPCWARYSARRRGRRSCCPSWNPRQRNSAAAQRISPRMPSPPSMSAVWATGAPPTT